GREAPGWARFGLETVPRRAAMDRVSIRRRCSEPTPSFPEAAMSAERGRRDLDGSLRANERSLREGVRLRSTRFHRVRHRAAIRFEGGGYLERRGESESRVFGRRRAARLRRRERARCVPGVRLPRSIRPRLRRELPETAGLPVLRADDRVGRGMA